jgi:hypothetical protein
LLVSTGEHEVSHDKKFLLLIASIAAALIIPPSGSAQAESLGECTGPFRACGIEVRASCSRDADGTLRYTFTDAWANWMRWEQCVTRIFEANGQQSPYRPASGKQEKLAGPPLTAPYTEMIYPFNYGRD